MNTLLRLRLRPDVHITQETPHRAVLQRGNRRLTLPKLELLGETWNALQTSGTMKNGLSAYARHALLKCEQAGFIRYEVLWDAQPALSLEPLATPYRLPNPQISPSTRLRASRFAIARFAERKLLLETPLCPMQVLLHTPEAAALWSRLGEGGDAVTLSQTHGRGLEETQAALEMLLCAGLIGIEDEQSKLLEEKDEVLRLWSPHEAYFHVRSRWGTQATPRLLYPYANEIPAPPAKKIPIEGKKIILETPPPLPTSITLAHALEQRHSMRRHNPERPLALSQLSALLYHALRGISVLPATTTRPYEAAIRPYPTGGALGALEVVVLAHNITGLARGAYHYDSWEHALVKIADENEHTQHLLRDAQSSANMEAPPHSLLIFSLRATRTLWKYPNMGYSLALKDMGVAMQTCYLIATALGLAGCALGNGDSAAFSRLTQNNPLEETSVGEFILGTL